MAAGFSMYRQPYYDSLGGFLTPAVRALLIATAAVLLAQGLFDGRAAGVWLESLGSLSWTGLRHHFYWQPLTYLFLHDGLWHFLMNMLGLFFFGPETERALGTRRFVGLYFLCGTAAGLGWLLWARWAETAFAACLGASGAVLGVLGAFAALFPERPITLLLFFVLPVTLRARTMAVGLGIVNLLSLAGPQGQIAYAAHVVGLIAGYGYIRLIYRGGLAPARFHPWRWLADLRWHWQRRKFKVIRPGDADPFAARGAPPDETEVDRILEKISARGLQSLSPRERDILERASRRK